MNFQQIDTNEKIKSFVLAELQKGRDFNDVLETINQVNNEKKQMLINEVIEERKKDHGYPPSSYCWIEMGSAGRMEQLYRTDQDNGLIYLSGSDDEENRKIEQYFQGFSEAVNTRFKDWGFALCPGQVMASNERWRGSLQEWILRTDHWIRVPKSDNVRVMTIFLDFEPLAGQKSIGSKLRSSVHETIEKHPLFLRFLAQDAWSGGLPGGEEPFDVKTGLLVHLVDGIRLFAIRHGCRSAGTQQRLKFLEEKGIFSPEFSNELQEAMELVMTRKLLASNNIWNPAESSKEDRQRLAETLKSLRVMKGIIREEFLPTI